MNHIILIANLKGGVGKSTFAYNLAKNLSKNASVAILDLDKQGSSILIANMADFDIIAYDDRIEEIKALPYDYIFIDTPPYFVSNFKELCGVADLILIPTQAGIYDFFGTEHTLKIIKELNMEDKTMIVLNKIKPNTNLAKEIQKKMTEFDVQLANTMIGDFVAIGQSPLIPLLENHKSKQQINELTFEIFDKLIKIKREQEKLIY